jgi:ferrochelatase
VTIGVLVMAYGTPASLDDVEGYYTHIRRGREPSPEQLADLIRRYEAIGGLSPLTATTEAQRAGIASALERREPGGYVVTAAHKHAPPFIEQGVSALESQGCDGIVGVVLAPHYSRGSIGEYHARAEAAAAVPYVGVDRWFDLPSYVAHQAASLGRQLDRLRRDGDGRPIEVRFTAHSLPLRVLEGDPYRDDLRDGAAMIAAAAGLGPDDWATAWQSAGRTPEPWAGPDVLEELVTLADQRAAGVVVVPHGFVADHLEVAYDLDIEAADTAKALGLPFARTEVINADEAVMTELANRVRQRAGSLG